MATFQFENIHSFKDDAPPWNSMDDRIIINFLNENTDEKTLGETLKMLEKYLIYLEEIEQYNTGELDKEIIEYSSFFISDLCRYIPIMEDIDLDKIKKVLKKYKIENPNADQIYWTLSFWFIASVHGKVEAIIRFLENHFKKHPDDYRIQKVLVIAEKYITEKDIEISYSLIGLITAIDRKNAPQILDRIIHKIQNQKIKEFAEDYKKWIEYD